MFRLLYSAVLLFFLGISSSRAVAQPTLACNASAGSPLIRTEGITERIGDIVLTCSGGSPGATITGNLTLFLSVNITNRVASNSSNVVTDVILTSDNGSGPLPINVLGAITGPGTLVYNGVSFMLSPTGSVTLRLANVRAAAIQKQAVPNSSIGALLSFSSGNPVSLTGNQFNVGTGERGLYAGFSSKIVCGPAGSPLPDNVASFTSFASSSAAFNSTRVTEGFADAFNTRGGFQGFNAAAGTRILVRYGGFPKNARLFVPAVVAGSDAVQPTAGGDFGVAASGGKYAPGVNGSLLLSLVQFADSTGAGGTPVFFPGAPGSGTVSFDAMTEISLSNGAGFAVYEVMDANTFIQESAQFPTFLGLLPFSGGAVETAEDVSLAAVSSVMTSTVTDPIPRFQPLPVPADCTIVGDCGAHYFPSLFVVESSLQYSAQAGSSAQADYVQVQNHSGGVMRWSATVTYQNSSGWLNVSPAAGINNGTVRVDAAPGSLAAGVYQAILTIDAGPLAGSRDVPVTLTIAAAPPSLPSPKITSVVNAATFSAGPVAPGSIATVMGGLFSGSSLMASFDGLPAQILFSNGTQINLLVPAALASKTSAQLTVQANGIASTPQTIALASFAPGIFHGGILNQDNAVNQLSRPAAVGSIIQIFATGLSGNGTITARIGDQIIDQPYYAGPAPGLPGVQQVDLLLPSDLTGATVNVSVCGGATPAQSVCSPIVSVALAQQ